MKFPQPTKSSEYPFYTLFYALLIWGGMMLYVLITSIGTITPDGAYTEQRDCLVTETTGRFDEQEECVEYSDPYYIPYGAYLKDRVKSTGIVVAIFSVIIGGYAMYSKMKSENEEREYARILSERIKEVVENNDVDDLFASVVIYVNGHFHPSVEDLSVKFDISEKRARKILDELYEHEFLTYKYYQ